MNLSTSAGSQLLRQQVYEYLRKKLKSETLKPGNTVRIKQLSEELGISRTPLRDALLQLQAEGFVTFLPQRGIRINELSDEDLVNIYEMLGALDSRALLSVCDRIGPREVSKMKRINQHMLRVIDKKEFNRYFELNRNFHNVYLDLCTNTPLLNQVNILRQRLFEFGAKGGWLEKVPRLNFEEHLIMIDLIENNRCREAADFMRDVHCAINW